MLEILATLSEIAGAAAVFGSLVFVGLQVREQANATRAQTELAIAANLTGLSQVIGQSAEAYAAGVLSTDPNLADLTDADQVRFLTITFAFFKHYENMYLQFRKGRIGKVEWDQWSRHILIHFHQPGIQQWWPLRKATFSPAFREFLENTPAPPEVSPAALHRAARSRRAGGSKRSMAARRRKQGSTTTR